MVLMYFGINGFIIRFAFTMQGITTAIVLSTSGYINASPQNLYPEQPPAAIFGLRAMLTLVPIAASIVTIWALQMYPLHSKRLKQMQAKTADLRKAKP